MPLATARQTKSKRITGSKRYPMNGGSIGYAGGLAMLDADGFLRPAAALASNKGCVGVFQKTVDNSAGADGAKYAVVDEGEFYFAATTIAQANVGAVVYAEDDQTVDETQGANEPRAGLLTEYVSASEACVRVSAEIAAL